MDHSSIYGYLKSITGIDALSIGEEAVDRVVKVRMKEGGYESVDDYLYCLNKSAKERQEFINDVTVPETWFFRDREPFKLLSEYSSKTCSSTVDGKLRILSIPCSTGEEPYSISMALLDSGFLPGSFVVDALDISTRVIEFAKKGVYGKNSFRGDDISFRDKYFNNIGTGYEIVDDVKASVNFYHRSILSQEFMQEKSCYDIVFCRNLLIYFNVETKEKVIKSLHRVLSPEGILFLGHAETGRMVNGLFDSIKHPGAFAYQPLAQEREIFTEIKNPPSLNFIPMVPYKPENTLSPVAENETISTVLDEIKSSERPILIDDVQELADRGELEKAIKLCRAYINKNPLSADGHFLQGVIYLAKSDNERAQMSFKRAIYLDPGHDQSLTHLSTLAIERGDHQAATNYRARIERVREKL